MFVDVNDEMFFGRQPELTRLEQTLEQKRVVGVSGMGGVGKTTFVCHYAYSHWERYKGGVYFVDASKISTLPINFAKLAGEDELNLVPRLGEDISNNIRLVSDWFRTHSEYLLIFDAADDVRILEELGKQRPNGLRYIPPRIFLRGHVIITSRCQRQCFDRVQIMKPIVLGDLSREETYSFLQRRVYNDEKLRLEEEAALKELVDCHMPGRLPLYVEQTASFVTGQNLTFHELLLEIKEDKNHRIPLDVPAFGDNRKCVDDTFAPSFDAVYKESPEAAELLNMSAFCHSTAIPAALFGGPPFAPTGTDNETRQGNITDSTYPDDNDVRALLRVPWRYHLVKMARESNDFCVHDVIQEQLCLRVEEQGNGGRILDLLANLLLKSLKSESVILTRKTQLLSHAESCATHMCRISRDVSSKRQTAFLKNSHRLQICTALVFAQLGSFGTAWKITEKLLSEMANQSDQHLRAELDGLRARICVWQHLPEQGLSHAREGLRRSALGNGPQTQAERLECAHMHKSCAHALVALYRCEGSEVSLHLNEAKKIFESLVGEGYIDRTYSGDYGHLLMLYGLMHRNIANMKQRRSGSEHHQMALALRWFQEAALRLNPDDYLLNLCQVHQILTEVNLGQRSLEDSAGRLKVCLEEVRKKLGENNRYTAWVLEKLARVLIEANQVREALEVLEQSLAIQERVYGEQEGQTQVGNTLLLKGVALLTVDRASEAVETLERAESMLGGSPGNPTFEDIQDHLIAARIHMASL